MPATVTHNNPVVTVWQAEPVRHVIYGAGAIGATIGGLLQHRGHEVVLIARGAHAATMARDGLSLLTPTEHLQLKVVVATQPSEANLTDDDVVFMAMKSQDSGAALHALAGTGFNGAVVCAQNGVDNERQALRHFERVYGMCVQLPGTFLEPGMVACHGSPALGSLDVGRYPHGIDDQAETIAAALRSAGFQSRAEADVMAIKHAKLLGNLANALDASVDRHAMRSELAKAARREGKACFQAAGIACVDQATYAERVKDVGIVELDGIAQRGSSSWQSLVKGTGSVETDYLNGEIVLLGRLYGVPTPVNAVLQRVVTDMARNHRPANSYRLEELEALVERERAAAPA